MSSRPLSFLHAHAEKIRFLLVGVWNTLFSVALYNIGLVLMKQPVARWETAGGVGGWFAVNGYIVLFWLVWVAAVVQSTATMKYLVFRDRGAFWPQVRRSYVIYLPAQGISTGVLWAAVRLAGLRPEFGQLVAIFITTIFSYLGHKYYTFADKPPALRPDGDS